MLNESIYSDTDNADRGARMHDSKPYVIGAVAAAIIAAAFLVMFFAVPSPRVFARVAYFVAVGAGMTAFVCGFAGYRGDGEHSVGESAILCLSAVFGALITIFLAGLGLIVNILSARTL
jgi:hypothetical protein